MDYRNKDMKHLFIKDKFDWQPWIVAAGIWILYFVSVPFFGY